MVQEIIQTIVDTVTGFCAGMGEAFVNTFNSLFMVETSAGVYEGLSNMGLFIIVMFAVSLGYGIIRWLTSFFRAEA